MDNETLVDDAVAVIEQGSSVSSIRADILARLQRSMERVSERGALDDLCLPDEIVDSFLNTGDLDNLKSDQIRLLCSVFGVAFDEIPLRDLNAEEAERWQRVVDKNVFALGASGWAPEEGEEQVKPKLPKYPIERFIRIKVLEAFDMPRYK